jgi:hypothetical protein
VEIGVYSFSFIITALKLCNNYGDAIFSTLLLYDEFIWDDYSCMTQYLVLNVYVVVFGVHTSQSCFLEQGDRCIREPSHLFESIVIVGLPPHADIQELENIALGRNDEDGKRSKNLFGNSHHQVHAITNLEPQVIIHLIYWFMLFALLSNTLWQGPAYRWLSKNKSFC